MMNIYNALIDGSVVKKGHWKLASGKHGELYVDKDKIITNPILYPMIVSRLSMLIREELNVEEFNIVTGPAVAGISFSAPVSLNLGKISVYPEKKYPEPSPGANNEVNDYDMVFRETFKKVIKGNKVVLVEDVITTSLSVMKTMKAIYECGGEVVGVFCIWKRDTGIIGLDPTGNDDFIPIYGLIEKDVDSWWPEECPLCKDGIPLYDPKTDKIIEG